jgi:methylglyoxal synthase
VKRSNPLRARVEVASPSPAREAGAVTCGEEAWMTQTTQRIQMRAKKNIVLIAHDSRKPDLLEWVKYNRAVLREHRLFATGTTGAIIEGATELQVTRFKSGPLGGDQQVGAKIAEGGLDVLIFFWDPLEPQPHDPDVKALLRIAVLYNIPTACNRATADFIVASSLFHGEYDRLLLDHSSSREEFIRARVSGGR